LTYGDLAVLPGEVTVDEPSPAAREPWYRRYLDSFDLFLVVVGTLRAIYGILRPFDPALLLVYLLVLLGFAPLLALLFFVVFFGIKTLCLSTRSPEEAPKRRMLYKALEVAVVILLGVVVPLLADI
jgi:hypothetical protein